MFDSIQISKINDFIFCPYSLYIHSIYEDFSEDVYHRIYQKRGKIKHKNIDNSFYSSSKRFLQGVSIFSSKYKLIGKLDIYDTQEKYLIERKFVIKKIFDGYKYQLYAEYFCLIERNYEVKKLFLHSLSDNKRYEINIPNKKEQDEFEDVLKRMRSFSFNTHPPVLSNKKCENCIYFNLCNFFHA